MCWLREANVNPTDLLHGHIRVLVRWWVVRHQFQVLVIAIHVTEIHTEAPERRAWILVSPRFQGHTGTSVDLHLGVGCEGLEGLAADEQLLWI
jgi:hypothetical protein